MARSSVLSLSLLCFVLVGHSEPAAAKDDAARKAKIEAAKRKLVEDENAFNERVNKAIEKGAAWLRTQQHKDGGFPSLGKDRRDERSGAYHQMDVGLSALAVLTLAHCGATAEDDLIQRSMNFCSYHFAHKVRQKKGGKRVVSRSQNLFPSGNLMVYVAATLILALDALHDQTPAKAKRVRRDRYGNPTRPKRANCKYPKSVARWMRLLVDFIAENQHKSGGWRYPGNPIASEEADSDLSNTQYAALALDAAARCGINAPPETWKRLAEHVIREQEEEGLEAPLWMLNEAWEPGLDDEVPKFTKAAQRQARGWTYLPGHASIPTGSMTAAGVTCLCLAKERLWAQEDLDATLRRRIDGALLDGMVWLSEYFAVDRNPEATDAPAQWHFYYLYGLERAGAKLGTRYFGKHDWYREGAEFLLSTQKPDGGWPDGSEGDRVADHSESPITQTCFALLFLKRSTRKPLIPMTPTITGGAADK